MNVWWTGDPAKLPPLPEGWFWDTDSVECPVAWAEVRLPSRNTPFDQRVFIKDGVLRVVCYDNRKGEGVRWTAVPVEVLHALLKLEPAEKGELDTLIEAMTEGLHHVTRQILEEANARLYVPPQEDSGTVHTVSWTSRLKAR